MWSVSKLFGRKNKTETWQNIVLSGEVNPRYLFVFPLAVFTVATGLIFGGTASLATTLPASLASFYVSAFYFRRQMYSLELNAAELRIVNSWGIISSRTIPVEDIDAFEFSMTGPKRNIVRIRIGYGEKTRTCRMYGLAYDTIAKFKHMLQLMNSELAVSTLARKGSTGKIVRIALTDLFAERAQQLNMTAPNRWMSREPGAVFRLVKPGSPGVERTYEFDPLVPENITIAKHGEQITDRRFRAKSCVVIAFNLWSAADHVNARVFLTYALERPQLRDKVTFVFLLFEDTQLAERFFGGKRVLSSSPLTYYAYHGKIKQKRMVVQTPAKINRDIEVLLATEREIRDTHS